MRKPEPILFLSDARGIYLPRDFARFINRECVTGVSAKEWAILENPDHDWYWETWDDVCRNAIVTSGIGRRYRVYQEGDCWLIPVGMEWNDQAGFFVWPEED